MYRFYQRPASYDSCSWDPEFLNFRHNFHAPTENRTSDDYLNSFITGSENVLNSCHGPQPARRDFAYDMATVARFMESPAGCLDGPACAHQIKLVADFCRYSKRRERDKRHVALIYEWENKPGRLIRQREAYSKPLTHEDLHTKLCRRRYAEPPSISAAKTDGPQVSNPEEISADRRVIYINNLNASTISILANTTSRLETPAIQRTIFRHLAAQTSLDVYIARGFKTFSLELHISYFCLRKDGNLTQCDQRQRWDRAGPLRRSLACPARPNGNAPGSHPSFSIYETQLSIAVTGVDHWRWTAWGFVDTWFEPGDAVSVYDEGEVSGSRPDPLSNGQLDVEPPECLPRKYFLRLLEIQIGLIAKEWEYILCIVGQEVRAIETDPLFTFPERSFQNKDGRESVRRLASWNGDMIRLVGTLLKTLSQTLVAWDAFQRTDISYFIDTDTCDDISSSSSSYASSIMGEENAYQYKPEKLAPSLRIIDKTFLNIQKTYEEMEQLKMTLEDLRRALARGGENYSTFVQQRTGEHIKLLTWITIGWSPVVIATGMCSAQEGIFPFRKDIWDFLASLLLISALVGLTIIILLRWQNSNLIDWKILSSSSDAATAQDDLKTGTSTGSPKPTSQERGRRATSFASSSRTFLGSYRRRTAGFGISGRSKSLVSKGMELGSLRNTVTHDGVGECTEDTGMSPSRAYHRAGKGGETEGPDMIV